MRSGLVRAHRVCQAPGGSGPGSLVGPGDLVGVPWSSGGRRLIPPG